MKKGLKAKIMWLMSLVILILVVFSIIVSYIFYSNAINMGVNAQDTTTSSTQFFIIFTCAEIIVALIIVVLIGGLAEHFIVRPLSDMSKIIDDTAYKADANTSGGIVFNDVSQQFKELNINTNDEIEELYQSIQKMQMDISEYITELREKDWESEHDSMTMLSNRVRFENRKKDVYPYVKSIYIACLDIINMSIVNTKLSTQAGDSIVGKVARELRRISCDTIHTYRMQEDKFLIAMCGYSEEEAISMITKWNERVGRLNRVTDSFDCRVVWGGSFGENDFNVDDIYKRADAEMYCQKMLLKNEIKSIT